MKKITLVLAAFLCWTGISALPRAEYPRPQFERAEWINLNGESSYTLDPGKNRLGTRLKK